MTWCGGEPELDFVAVRESCESEEILHVFSDVDIASSSAFGTMLCASPVFDKKLLVDLTECPYMDSTGLRHLIGAHNVLGPGLEIRVAANSLVAKVFAVSGVDRILSVVAAGEATLPLLTGRRAHARRRFANFGRLPETRPAT